MRLLSALMISGLAFVGPMGARAEEEKKSAEPKAKNSLLETQQRLDALIKAAAAHNLVDVGPKGKSQKGHGKVSVQKKPRLHKMCKTRNFFVSQKNPRLHI